MSRLLLPGALALILAIGLVLALAGGEEDVSVEEPGSTQIQPRTSDTSETPSASPGPEENGAPPRIVQAVTRYVEAAERGEVPTEGLPTTDELTIRRVVVDGPEARVLLAGGARLTLREQGARWRVVAVSAPEIEPSPPSNG